MISGGTPARTSSTAALSTGAGSTMIISSAPSAKPYASGVCARACRASPSKRIAASASYATRWHTPASEDIASNSRPMLEVGTLFSPVSSCRLSTVRSAGGARGDRRQPRIPVQLGRAQVRQGHPAGIAYAGVAPGQQGVAQVPGPAVAAVVRDQHLATPDGAVVAVTRAVEGEADHRFVGRMAVLRHGRGDVRVMVLDLDQRAVVVVPVGPARAAIARMPVADQHLGLHRGHPDQVPVRLVEGLQGGQVVHVPDVTAHPGQPPVADAEGVLQVTADGQRRGHRHREGDGHRGIAAGAADRKLITVDDPQHRVVAGDLDPPVVAQPGVGQVGQPFARLLIVGDDGFAGSIATGHHQRGRAGGVARPARRAGDGPGCRAASPPDRGSPGPRPAATLSAGRGWVGSRTTGRRGSASSRSSASVMITS